MKKIFFLLTILLAYTNAYANNFLFGIPDTIRKNANSIIHENSININVLSKTKFTKCVKFTITILNKNGEENGDILLYIDENCNLDKFRGTIYDFNGHMRNEIKKPDLSIYTYSGHYMLKTDMRAYMYDVQMTHYPYTVSYEYEISSKVGFNRFPTFFLQSDYEQGVIKSQYRVTAPEDFEMQIKQEKFPSKATITRNDGQVTYTWIAENIPPIKAERDFSPEYKSIFPHIEIAPVSFTYFQTSGSQKSWTDFGEWIYQLCQDKDILPADLKEKVHAMCDNKTPIEQLSTLYEYLGKSTRYVGIESGLLGFQTIPAEETYKTGFGDCKGLTNYLKAMLKEIGIPSYEILVNTHTKEITQDFYTSQFNHEILCVPFEKDTFWIECTNPDIPLGYTHQGLAGHDAVIINGPYSKLIRIPSYADSLNVSTRNIQMNIKENGDASISVQTIYKMTLNELFGMKFEKLGKDERIKEISQSIHIPLTKISEVSVKSNKGQNPSTEIQYHAEIQKYASCSSNRLFIPINRFNNNVVKLPETERLTPIYIEIGYNDCDTITFNIPSGYTIESIPPDFEYKSEFGICKMNIKITEQQIIVVQHFSLYSGSYTKEKYNDLLQLMKECRKLYNSQIVLRKKQ